MNPDPRRVALRAFLGKLCDVSSLGDQDDLFAGGFVNSLYLVSLLNFVQEEFSVVLDEEDFDMANFRSIQSVLDFVARKRGEA